VPHHVRNMDNPTVSTIFAAIPMPTISRGLFSVKTWARIVGADVAMKIRPPR